MSHHHKEPNYTITQQEQALLNNRNAINQIAKDMMLLNRVSLGGSNAEKSKTNQSSVLDTSDIYGSRSMHNQSIAESESKINRLDDIETAILRSNVPIDLNETEEITVNGEKGIWANKNEIVNWRGHFPISNYPINDDPNPEIIRKRTEQQLVYHQEVAIRYLRPPTPPAPGEILIQQEGNSFAPPAPPLVIRQQPARPTTPPPLVVREAPPAPPPAVGRKVILVVYIILLATPANTDIHTFFPLINNKYFRYHILFFQYLPIECHIFRRVFFPKISTNYLF